MKPGSRTGYRIWFLSALAAGFLLAGPGTGYPENKPGLDLREYYGNVFHPVISPGNECRQWMTVQELYACLKGNREINGDESEDGEWHDMKVESLPDPFRVLVISLGMDRSFYLLEKRDERVRVITFLGGEYEPGAFGIHETFKISAVRRGQVAGREYLWIETFHDRGDSDLGANEYESLERKEVMVLFPDGRPPIIRFPLGLRYERNSLTESAAGQNRDLPIFREVILTAELSNDGILTISLKRGHVNELPSLPGAHRVLEKIPGIVDKPAIE